MFQHFQTFLNAYFEVNLNKSRMFIISALEPRGELATQNYCLWTYRLSKQTDNLITI
jgi:hypothetical protein